MRIAEVIEIVKTVFFVFKELYKIYQQLEAKFHWAHHKGPQVKREVRNKKRHEFDIHAAKIIERRTGMKPPEEVVAFVRELVHNTAKERQRVRVGKSGRV